MVIYLRSLILECNATYSAPHAYGQCGLKDLISDYAVAFVPTTVVTNATLGGPCQFYFS
jgi:hypothetical protein